MAMYNDEYVSLAYVIISCTFQLDYYDYLLYNIVFINSVLRMFVHVVV